MPSPFPDLALSQRLERAEGYACAQFAEGRRRAFPQSGSAWMDQAGTFAVFDGLDSPLTQSFGLGVGQSLTPDSLDLIERWFRAHRAAPVHEVSPFAGVDALQLLCDRGYRPIEISNVMYRSLDVLPPPLAGARARLIASHDSDLWTDINVRAWAADHPEYLDFLKASGAVSAVCPNLLRFMGEIDIGETESQAGSAASLWIHGGIALLGGAATVPELRRRGLHAALLETRLRYAAGHGCDVAMMAAEPGSDSHRNAERQGFRVAYTRTKWRLKK